MEKSMQNAYPNQCINNDINNICLSTYNQRKDHIID